MYMYCICRCVAFHPDGHSLFSGAQDSMRVYGWEPVRCYDSFSLGWGKVSDIAISSSQLVSDKLINFWEKLGIVYLIDNRLDLNVEFLLSLYIISLNNCSETLLIRSPKGLKNLAVFRGWPY